MSEIELIDSHCHLIFENFEKDIEDVVQRLRSRGVRKLVHACCELTEIPKLKKISHEFSEIYYSVGLHPLEAKKWNLSSKSLLRKSAQEDSRVVAIGELGLDFFKRENKTQQIDALLPQMELAYELELPVIIHCRDAAVEMIEICNDLSKKGKCPRGVLHCWTGTPKEMKQFLDLGFYISFSGIVTFPKAHEIHECAKIVPNNKYLIETDSPFLAPVPHRGKRNEPAYVENVANFIANLRSTELNTIAKESSKNAKDLFKFDLLS
ncbi:TatD family hydrolase [Prochlorococcus marinus XMU1419]|uniref:TatD family hydrolase n=1 Tax=Prochlorococcus marinus TaxID=1219 RepID=UPI001ADCBD93|nr:TatD family hydrolase [Prochlorococcus marinus]MBO8234482.1 TatD family hydrolase [Prochlorococcus marinus XMU1419]MBW3076155.1 deoxyribonuclease [Prochlorococcus marinus str. XMU1419]